MCDIRSNSTDNSDMTLFDVCSVIVWSFCMQMSQFTQQQVVASSNMLLSLRMSILTPLYCYLQRLSFRWSTIDSFIRGRRQPDNCEVPLQEERLLRSARVVQILGLCRRVQSLSSFTHHNLTITLQSVFFIQLQSRIIMKEEQNRKEQNINNSSSS